MALFPKQPVHNGLWEFESLRRRMTNKNIRYVDFHNDEERKRLVEDYESYGYNVKVADGRIVVNSKWPTKPKEKKNDRKVDRRREE